MAQAIPFPADFTQTAIIELNQNFIVPISTNFFLLRGFVETGSNDAHVFASLIDVTNPQIFRFLSAKSATDTSGDNGILVTIGIVGNQPIQITCTLTLLQRGAQRYQNPRLFS